MPFGITGLLFRLTKVVLRLTGVLFRLTKVVVRLTGVFFSAVQCLYLAASGQASPGRDFYVKRSETLVGKFELKP